MLDKDHSGASSFDEFYRWFAHGRASSLRGRQRGSTAQAADPRRRDEPEGARRAPARHRRAQGAARTEKPWCRARAAGAPARRDEGQPPATPAKRTSRFSFGGKKDKGDAKADAKTTPGTEVASDPDSRTARTRSRYRPQRRRRLTSTAAAPDAREPLRISSGSHAGSAAQRVGSARVHARRRSRVRSARRERVRSARSCARDAG